MANVDRELPAAFELAHEIVSLVRINVPGASAPLALQMGVLRVGQDVVFLAAVSAMAMVQVAELLEHVQRPIQSKESSPRRARDTVRRSRCR